jgi:DNA-binding MarR family transcriptional regulator
MGHNRRFDDGEVRAWRRFLLAHTRVLSRLDADLVADCDMTLAEFEVLSHLAEAPERQLRMNELAELARLSPSGLTRRFDALARRGWVARARCDDDRRGVLAQLSDDGFDAFSAATPVHDRGVRDYFLDVLDTSSVPVMADMMGALADANAPDASLARV